jgi:hypothetical protein
MPIVDTEAPGGYDALIQSWRARAVDPEGFTTLARPGRTPPDPMMCLRVACGNLTQADVGPDLLADCTFGGFQGVFSCKNPICAPYCQQNPVAQQEIQEILNVTGEPPTINDPVIPYSPANGPEPNPFFGRTLLGNETKRRRGGAYQEMVMCPGGEQTLYQIGLNTWQGGLEAVADKMQVMADLSFEEIAGLWTPIVGLTAIGWMLFGTSDAKARTRF